MSSHRSPSPSGSRLALIEAQAAAIIGQPKSRRELLDLALLCSRLYTEAFVGALDLDDSHESQPPESHALTATEMAKELGPSWTARTLYRCRDQMPPGCVRRIGGRLYFSSEAVRAWAAGR